MKNIFKKIYNTSRSRFKAYIQGDEFELQVRKWFKDDKKYNFRTNYPELNKNSIVLDIGGYYGDFAFEINKKYSSKVLVFEPHPIYFEKYRKRFQNNMNITVYNFGLSDTNETLELSNDGDASSFILTKNDSYISCSIREFSSVYMELGLKEIDLIKLNIEGGEFQVLSNIHQQIGFNNFKNIQVQFHNFVPNAKEKRVALLKEISKSHHPTFSYPFVWENFERNGKS